MLTTLWSKLRSFVDRVLGRRAPEPGRFEPGHKGSWRGWLAIAPWALPRRDYLVYVPCGHSRWRRAPLLVLIHGCRQSPEDIAAGTRIAALADELGALVLLPRQVDGVNPYGCWNWFDHATVHGWGETAIVAAQIRAVRRRYRVDRRRVFVAGMSSGAALAAVLGLRRPDLVAGVFAHSGIPVGAASSPFAALAVLRQGADRDVVRVGRQARADAPAEDLPVPVVVVHGDADDVVAAANAAQLVRQYLALNGHPAAAEGIGTELPPGGSESSILHGERTVVTTEWRVDGHPVARHVLVHGLGHAWSGGDASLGWNDPAPPDATQLFGAFVRETAG